MAHLRGGQVQACETSEYGKTVATFDEDDALFSGQPGESVVWMSHTDRIAKLPEGFQINASTDHCPIAAMS